MDAKWAERWKRMGDANERARRERLRSRTVEESIALFEQMMREWDEYERKYPEMFGDPERRVPRSPSPGLIKYWKKT